MESFDCIVVGGGPAGLGVGSILQELKVERLCILERAVIGASFRMWPEEMRMITPSFTGNAYGMLDLNAISPTTSPAYTLGTEHPSGKAYADYLEGVAAYRELPVRTGVDVTDVQSCEGGGFELRTSAGPLRSRFVVWAAGEFQYPRLDAFPGAEHGVHSSLIRSWRDWPGEEAVIVGGYESGADAAIHLSRLGKRVTLIDRNGRWTEKGSSDPSVELSPFTKDRLRDSPDGRMDLLAGWEVKWIEHDAAQGRYLVYCENGVGESRFVQSDQPPILATGFKGSLQLVSHLFERDVHGAVMLGKHDESTQTSGLFVCGPGVAHGHLLLCFIYKFRQRFGVVAGAVAERLGLDTEALSVYQERGMLLDDLSCCEEDCQC
ncbi:NAD(P)-binding domain-containing protein [Paenibacillus sp. IB182496]|uniref:NAD(P)-binding domain-containing protein n=1 Tax=Paenibacillus sabuli TaxID=2772509 RepID=A0A927BTF2_9BACL|nr:NAD(P)/FAD-dependent oxidoreductase [Paenibacillus sabuli]MBD2845350.1 NAD(P)-binding domain-containing protein [Paenibacillus sabuli]